MNEPTEEQLMSYADGVLDAETARWVATCIAGRPDLARKVAMYRESLGLGDIIGRGMPQHDDAALAARIMAHPLPTETRTAAGQAKPAAATASTPRGGTVVQFPGPRSERSSRRPASPNLALVAGVAALVAGAVAMTMVQWQSSAPDGAGNPSSVVGRSSSTGSGDAGPVTLAASTLNAALETTPSSHSAPAAGGWTIEPVLTFEAGDGRYCREYRARHDAGSSMAGVACRSTAASWQIVAQAAAAGTSNSSRGYDPVSKRNPPPEAVNKAIADLKGKDPLDGQQEADLIARRWK